MHRERSGQKCEGLDHCIALERRSRQTSNLSSTSDDNVFLLPRINFEFKPRHANWTVQRRQFPLRLAYASTLNSCQGLTLDRVVLDLTRPVFAHGQLNTGLTRLRTKGDIRILRDPAEIGLPIPNVVYHNLLL